MRCRRASRAGPRRTKLGAVGIRHGASLPVAFLSPGSASRRTTALRCLPLAAILASPACGVQKAEPAPQVPPSAVSVSFRRLIDLEISGARQQALSVVKTAAEWEDLWSRISAPVAPPRDAPAVDFSHRMVVIAALGQRPTGGFGVRIGAVYEDRDRLYVVYTETSPGAGCLTSQAFTAPVSAVSVPLSEKPASFVRRAEEEACQ